MTLLFTNNIIIVAHESEVNKLSAEQKKRGRPFSDNPMDYEVKARIDKATNEKLNAYCEKHGMSKTDVVRKGIDKVIDEK